MIVLAVKVQLLPAGGLPPAGLAAHPDITIQYLALPALSMALPAWAVLTRYLTEGLRTQMNSPYVTTGPARRGRPGDSSCCATRCATRCRRR